MESLTDFLMYLCDLAFMAKTMFRNRRVYIYKFSQEGLFSMNVFPHERMIITLATIKGDSAVKLLQSTFIWNPKI